ncbi:hypothetical protein [Jiella pacifica]|uniref:Uncharacterized protein n=1 Tax=Jiella pacifica TaxID=2696469 RepID=A0A6N9TC69_9HYPH|nr:hypothetical protein [Jiella pacifica]NDW06478.1 hypothetical protein [Jiella pacifica]
MSSDLRSELGKTFDLAIRRHEAKVLKTSHDWKTLQDIEERHNRAREAADQGYRQEYGTRVEQARLDILAEKTSRTFDIRPPFGTDNFRKDAIDREAHRRVQADHDATIAGINEREVRAIETLLSEATERRALDGAARKEFGRATDRRSGRDRRINPSFD